MKTVLMTVVSAVLLGSVGVANAASRFTPAPHENLTVAQGTWMADASMMSHSKACGGYGYAFGGQLCETETGGPVGGIGN